MQKTTKTRQDPVAFAGTNAEGEAKVWVRKLPSPRRSVVGKVRDAISRAKLQVKSEPVRLRKKLEALEKENANLRFKNGIFRMGMRPIPDTQQTSRNLATSGSLTSDNDVAAVNRPTLEDLAKENKELHAKNFILSQMPAADAQMKKVFEALTDRGSTWEEVREATKQLFQILHGLNAQRAHSVGLYSERFQAHLSAMAPKMLDRLVNTASTFLALEARVESHKAVVETISFCARAQRLWNKTDNVNLRNFKKNKLQSISEDATALRQHVHQHASHLQPNDRIPGTKFTVQALEDLLKDSVAAKDRQTVTRATNIIQAATKSELTKISPADRTKLDRAFKVHHDRPELFNDTQKQAVKNLKERLNRSPKAGAALTAQQPAVPVTMIKVTKAALDKAALDKAASDKAKANSVDEAKGFL